MIPFKEHYGYPSRRAAVYGARGMVATSHPLAVEAGMAVLRRGGNAVDAAVATAAALSVVDPASTGPGGDLFAILSVGGKIYGLNASGHSAQLMTREALAERGHTSIPPIGWLPVTVSGGVAGWAALCKRFGKLAMSDSFAPAIELAQGHPASFMGSAGGFVERNGTDPIFKPFAEAFLPGGERVRGTRMAHLKDLGESLRDIAATEGESFYRGRLAEIICEYAEKTGGLLRYDDFASYECEWVDPVSVNYRGYDIWEMPPNGNGIAASMAINIMEGFAPIHHADAQTVHRAIEAVKLGFADLWKYSADPRFTEVPVKGLLSREYAATRRALIGDFADTYSPGVPNNDGTVYLCAADGEGNMVSLIQSVANHWGSGVVVPGTGILMQNRGANFSMDAAHPNALAPRKRAQNTIIPGFISKGGVPVGPFGVMGGNMQPQGHLQVVMNMLDYGMNPQAALDAPRFFYQRGKLVQMEKAWPQATLDSLTARGHEIDTAATFFGRGAIIVRNEEGVLCGGTEPRGGGAVAGY